MPTIADFSSLDHAATALGDHAHDLRTQVARLRAGAASVQWSSAAANAFRTRSDHVCAALTQCAAGLDSAALELHQHASTARGRLRDVAGPVVAGIATAAHAATDVADVAGDIWHAVS